MAFCFRTFVAIFVFMKCSVDQSLGHGRLLRPPSRSSMWRMGFETPKNYNDNELSCGGLARQQRNGMRCGVCGDPFDLSVPRANEMGGKYYKGIMSQFFVPEQIIQATVELTANHRGYFEFRICAVNGDAARESEKCFQENPLEVIGEGLHTDKSLYKYFVPRPVTGNFVASLKLPQNLSCDHCVLQWTYTAANNWGQCEDSSYAVGCGPQETFRGCADIAIGRRPKKFPVEVFKSVVLAQSKPMLTSSQHFETPSVTKSWDHRQNLTAWPNNVNPGYPVESNKTTWFYHRWPNTPNLYAEERTRFSETIDLRILREKWHRWHRTETLQKPGTIKAFSNRKTNLSQELKGNQYSVDHSDNRQRVWNNAKNIVTSRNLQFLDELKTSFASATNKSTIKQPNLPSPPHKGTSSPVLSADSLQNEAFANRKFSERHTVAPRSNSCVAAGLFSNVPEMTDWCNQNCFFNPPYCPASHCSCLWNFGS